MSTEHWSISKPIVCGGLAAVGIFYLGYKTGTGQWGSNIFTKTTNSKRVFKSYNLEDPVKSYCLDHSTPLSEIQKKLMEETLNHPRGMMLGAPEVLSLNAAFLKALKAKKVIDVGVFTGASSLAAALALPEDGKVIACDINEDFTRFVLKIIGNDTNCYDII